ncbi:TRAP transporter small permease [Uliginosibacterium flavum]|uniref:TRAP transporter small permease protein n=1 Tax=Uliginosibacterium flavum TaxID=1396831 RepID=A0ABV2TMB7_9RHOO
MKRLIPPLETAVEWLMALALGVMVLAIGSNVVLRYVFNTGIPAAEEVARLMFVWMIFLGAILALHRGAHLGMEIFQARLPRSLRRACAIVSHLLILYALWLFLVGSWDQTVIGLNTYSTVLGFPMALMASGGLVCAAAMLPMVALNLWRIVTKHPAARIPGEAPAVHHAAETAPEVSQ